MKERFRNHVQLISGNLPTNGDFQVALESMLGGTGDLDWESQTEYDAGTPFLPGDVLFGKLRPYLVKVWLADRPGYAVGDIHVYRPRPGVVPNFLKYVVLDREFIRRVDAGTYGAKMPRADWGDIREIEVCFPSVDKQRAIADYLNRETAQIDAMILAQTSLLECLRERSLAGLRSYITGRDHNGPKQASGEAWVGDVPSHWEVRPMRSLFGTIGSGTTPLNEFLLDADDDAVQWVTTSELRERAIQRTKQTLSRETLLRTPALRLYDPGTLLVAMYGATIGRLGWLDVQACTNQACCAFAKPRGVLPSFAFCALWAAREHLIVLGAGGGQPNLNQQKLRSLRIPVPPLDEQGEITARIEAEGAGMANVVDAGQQVIELLRERREALITAAVAGRIDPKTGIEQIVPMAEKEAS